MSEPLYAERDAADLGDYYVRHVMAMTAEGLHAKSAIAAELAWRDRELALVRRAAREEMREEAAKACEALIDHKEAERARLAAKAAEDTEDECARLRHTVNVGLHNGAMERCARAVRALPVE